jgi:hypothetical protein
MELRKWSVSRCGRKILSERSPAPLRYATKKVHMISELLIMVQDSIYRQPGLTDIALDADVTSDSNSCEPMADAHNISVPD